MHIKALIALAFTIVIWGITSAFARAFSLAVSPYEALIIRTIISAVLFAVALAVGPGFSLPWRDWPKLVTLSLIGMLGYYMCSVFGFAYAPAGLATLVFSLQPLMIVTAAWFIGTEKLTPAIACGIVVSMVGTGLLLFDDPANYAQVQGNDIWKGVGLMLVSCVAWTIYVIFTKPLIQAHGAFKITGLSCVIIAIPLLPLVSSTTISTVMSLKADAILALVFLTTLAATTSVATWNYAAGHLRPAALGSSMYVIPLVAIVSSWLMLGEPITPIVVLAGSIILAGVALSEFGKDIRSFASLGAFSAIVFAVLCWGGVPIAMRYLLFTFSPQEALVMRLFPAGLLACVILLFTGIRTIERRDWWRILLAAFLGNLGYQVLAAFGMQLIPASWTGMIFGLEPVFIALFACLFSTERVTLQLVTGILVALAGTAVLVLGGTFGGVKDAQGLGVWLVTISTLGWAIYTTLIRPISAKYGAFATANVVLAVSAMPVVLFTGHSVIPVLNSVTLNQWYAIAFLSVFATVLAVGAWNYALGYMSSSRAGMFLYVQPVVAAIGGILLLDEVISAYLIAGGILIILGVLISELGGRLFISQQQSVMVSR